MEKYIGEIIGAVAVIIAALIGLLAKKGSSNQQVAKNINNSKVFQANGSMTINGKDNTGESDSHEG